MKKIVHCIGWAILMANCILALSIMAGIIMFGSAKFTFYEPNQLIIWTEIALAFFGIGWFNWMFWKKVVNDDE